MPTPGWYLDPGGRPGHYRYWDGQTWAPTTSTNPAGPAPEPTSTDGPHASRGRRGRWGVVLAAVSVVLVLAVVGALVVRSGNRPVVDLGPSPTSTATGGEDTTPTATPSAVPSPSPRPPATPSPSPSSSAAQPSEAPCPVGNPFARQDHARDGRVHGGSLSFPGQPGWEDPGQQVSAFTWAYDVGETDIELEPRSFAAYAVGALSVADGFEDPQTAAELTMRCTVASALYRNVSSRTDLVDEETTVDGYRAWTLRSEIRVADGRTSSSGDTVQITVVDLDSPEALAFFWGSAPIGDETFDDRLDRVTDELEVG